MNEFQTWLYRRFMMKLASDVIDELMDLGCEFDDPDTGRAFDIVVSRQRLRAGIELWNEADWIMYGKCEAEMVELIGREIRGFIDNRSDRGTMNETKS